MRNINNLRGIRGPEGLFRAQNNQPEIKMNQDRIQNKGLFQVAISLFRKPRNLQVVVKSASAHLSVLKKVPFPLKNLNYWASFQPFKMHSPQICDLGFGLSLSNGC